MPTYDYRCDGCEHEFELFQQMSAAVKRKCPECGKLTLKRLIGTGAGVLFKGGGFYETDYRSDAYRKAAESDKKPADSKTDSKTDTKAGAKADANGGSKGSDASGKKAPAGDGSGTGGTSKKGKKAD